MLHCQAQKGARVTLVTAHLIRRQHPALNLGRLAPSGDHSAPHHPKLGPQEPQGGLQSQGSQPGPSGAQGGPRRPPPEFADIVDLTTDEEDIDEAPATPPLPTSVTVTEKWRLATKMTSSPTLAKDATVRLQQR